MSFNHTVFGSCRRAGRSGAHRGSLCAARHGQIQSRALTWLDLKSTLTNPRVWPHLLICIPPIAAVAAIGTYSPTLIKSFGFTTLKANALSSVGGFVLLVNMLIFGYLSDRTRARGALVIIALTFLWVWWIVFQYFSLSTNKWLKYAFLVLIGGTGQAFHPINATWLSLNQFTPQQRSVAMAMFVMSANTGLLSEVRSCVLQTRRSTITGS